MGGGRRVTVRVTHHRNLSTSATELQILLIYPFIQNATVLKQVAHYNYAEMPAPLETTMRSGMAHMLNHPILRKYTESIAACRRRHSHAFECSVCTYRATWRPMLMAESQGRKPHIQLPQLELALFCPSLQNTSWAFTPQEDETTSSYHKVVAMHT
jgi:hypothetical protein